MNVKQKRMLGGLVLAFSILFVVSFVSIYPFGFDPGVEIPDPPSGNEITISGKPILDQPTLTDIDGNIDLHWSGVSGALAYQVYMMQEGGTYLQIRLTLSTSYTKYGLTDGTYAFKVRGYDEEGYTSMSDFRVVVVAIPPPPPPPPSAPELYSISPTTDTDGFIDLRWSSVSGATIYKVYKSKDGGSWVSVVNTGATSIVHQISVNGNYRFGVKASNVYGDSVFSNIGSVVVNIPEEEPPPQVPDAPILCITTDSLSTDGEIKLEWDLVSGATKYTIYRSKDGGSVDTLKEGFSENYYDDSVLENGVYLYKAKAGNDVGYSEYSNEVSVTVQIPDVPVVPEAPILESITPEVSNDGVISLSWNLVSDALYYEVYRSYNGSSFELIETLNENYYDDLTSETGVYSYNIKAGNDAGISEVSNTEFVVVYITDEIEPIEPIEPTDDYTMLYILLGVLGILIVPIVIILIKRRKNNL